MNIINPPNVNLSQIVVDSGLDLSGGDYDIVMKAGRTVDGKDVGGAMLAATFDPDSDDVIEGAQVAINPAHTKKLVSDNLRHSIDGEGIPNNHTYALQETMTFTNGIKGTLRVKFDINNHTSNNVWGRIYKNGVALGAEQTTAGGYTTKSEDIDVGTLAPGDTLELWCRSDTDYYKYKNFRVYYDNEVAVART